MSLHHKEAVIQHDPRLLSPEQAADKIDDMGFPARLQTQPYKDAVVFIEGMTCMSCVRNIEGVISIKPGVKFIKVSLEKKLAYVKFDPVLLTAEIVRDAIDDMGFEASLSPPEVQGSVVCEAQHQCEVKVAVEGMTCQSCVRTIEDTMSKKEGVEHIKVSLQDKEAVIEYNPALTSPQALCDQIDDMGFDASLVLEEFDNLAKERTKGDAKLNTEIVKIHVEGMTCNSCVKTIEGVMSDKPGVVSIKVSLEAEEAVVDYRPELTQPSVLRDHIDDMGFDASLPMHTEHTGDEFEALAQRNGTVGGGGPSCAVCTVDVKGMVCQSCVQNIQSHISQCPSVLSITVSLEEEKAFIKYLSAQITAEEIAAKIDDMGFDAKLLTTHPDGATHNHLMTVDIKGMHCNSCTRSIEGRVGDMAGVGSVSVSLLQESARVVYDPTRVTAHDIVKAIMAAGDFTATLIGKSVFQNHSGILSLSKRSMLATAQQHSMVRNCTLVVLFDAYHGTVNILYIYQFKKPYKTFLVQYFVY